MNLQETVRRHTGELRYLDPVTAQVYQSTFMFVIAMSLLISELLSKFGIASAWMRTIYVRWPDIDAWSAVGGILGLMLFLSPPRTEMSRLLMLAACCYWFAFAGRMTIVFGWSPFSGPCFWLLAVLAAWGYVRATTAMKDGAC